MSSFILKKKTQTQYNNMSVGQKQFSLNGGHRSQGFIGQTSLSRSLPRTPMKGNVPKGHGGCCGSFLKHHIIQSAVVSLNNPNIIKPSVINTRGMIHTHYRWILRPQPYSVFKTNETDQINTLRNKTIQYNTNVVQPTSGIVNSGCAGLNIAQRPKVCVFITKNLLNPENNNNKFVNCQDGKPRMKNILNIPVVGGIHS